MDFIFLVHAPMPPLGTLLILALSHLFVFSFASVTKFVFHVVAPLCRDLECELFEFLAF